MSTDEPIKEDNAESPISLLAASLSKNSDQIDPFNSIPDDFDDKLSKLSLELQIKHRQLQDEFKRRANRLNTALPGTLARVEQAQRL